MNDTKITGGLLQMGSRVCVRNFRCYVLYAFCNVYDARTYLNSFDASASL